MTTEPQTDTHGWQIGDRLDDDVRRRLLEVIDNDQS